MKEDDKDNEPDKKPNLKGLGSYMALTQFAYTLAIVPLILGWLGHLAGTHLLGGSPWNVILMIAFGLFGFAGELYRFIKVADALAKKDAADLKNRIPEKKDKVDPWDDDPWDDDPWDDDKD